ncbi:response regulator transcription factor [Hydrocarboniphaga sp.]|uniref:response regulator transcription factor n=1 Tax=Hydrocarboniphaga sp. TaxID=2033016 RepID=UPI00261AACD9|nr:response regulator transcription factor [Hydrocarboniphaga sp.]
MRVLLIEDHQDIAENVGEYLEQHREIVDYAANGVLGLHLAVVNPYDVIVLDLTLPGLDGLAISARLRSSGLRYTPILMLTSRDTLRDKLAGFDAGADDYLTKPFALDELYARLKVLARRAGAMTDRVLSVGELHFDTGTLLVRRRERLIDLTPSVLKLLEALMRASPNVVSRAEAQHAIWGENPPNSDAALRLHIHALRIAIDQGEAVKMLHTVHGIGYRIVEPDH